MCPLNLSINALPFNVLDVRGSTTALSLFLKMPSLQGNPSYLYVQLCKIRSIYFHLCQLLWSTCCQLEGLSCLQSQDLFHQTQICYPHHLNLLIFICSLYLQPLYQTTYPDQTSPNSLVPFVTPAFLLLRHTTGFMAILQLLPLLVVLLVMDLLAVSLISSRHLTLLEFFTLSKTLPKTPIC